METQLHWINQMFIDSGALWIHDDNPRRPHALLTSGKHSNGFFNASVIINNPLLMEIICRQLVSKMLLPCGFQGMVFGSAMGAVTIAYEIARQLCCKSGFTEPAVYKGVKKMICKRFDLRKGERVVVVEDVMTTGGTTQLTVAELRKKGAKIHNKIGVLVNRSGSNKLGRFEVVGLIEKEMPIWEANECPLCEAGSEALRPKGNWDLLTAKYKEG